MRIRTSTIISKDTRRVLRVPDQVSCVRDGDENSRVNFNVGSHKREGSSISENVRLGSCLQIACPCCQRQLGHIENLVSWLLIIYCEDGPMLGFVSVVDS
jgi:hypothetical protein